MLKKSQIFQIKWLVNLLIIYPEIHEKSPVCKILGGKNTAGKQPNRQSPRGQNYSGKKSNGKILGGQKSGGQIPRGNISAEKNHG